MEKYTPLFFWDALKYSTYPRSFISHHNNNLTFVAGLQGDTLSPNHTHINNHLSMHMYGIHVTMQETTSWKDRAKSPITMYQLVCRHVWPVLSFLIFSNFERIVNYPFAKVNRNNFTKLHPEMIVNLSSSVIFCNFLCIITQIKTSNLLHHAFKYRKVNF